MTTSSCRRATSSFTSTGARAVSPIPTDLDGQLKQHGIQKIILIGMIANTCIEAIGPFGQELGYHVTLIKDATAAFSHEAMHAAHDINGPTYARDIFTTDELLAQLSA